MRADKHDAKLFPGFGRCKDADELREKWYFCPLEWREHYENLLQDHMCECQKCQQIIGELTEMDKPI